MRALLHAAAAAPCQASRLRLRRCAAAMSSPAAAPDGKDAPAGVQIVRLLPEHAERGAVTVQRAFDNEYSWSRPLGMTQERFSAWMRHAYLPERAAGSPPSLVAISAAGDVAGVCTLEDFNAPEAHNEEEEQPAGMVAIESILAECKRLFWHGVSERALPLSAEQQGVIAYVAFLAVHEGYRRQRVGAALVARAVAQLTAEQGYGTVVAFCTSAKSRALFTQQGFEHWAGVSYQRFTMPDGSLPFATLPVDECAVMVHHRRE